MDGAGATWRDVVLHGGVETVGWQGAGCGVFDWSGVVGDFDCVFLMVDVPRSLLPVDLSPPPVVPPPSCPSPGVSPLECEGSCLFYVLIAAGQQRLRAREEKKQKRSKIEQENLEQ